jgi:hypothetical protein
MALLILACIGCGKEVTAAEWTLKGSLGQQLQYNDNMALSTISKEAVVGYLLTPSLQATRKTGALDIGFQGQGLVSRYDNSRWDCDNYNLGLNNTYRVRRSVFSLNGGYSVSCSYAQQLTQTGILVPNSQSINYRLVPSWTWQWTPRNQIILASSYSKTTYSNSSRGSASNTGIGFSGNDTYAVNLSGNHLWSRRLSLNGRLGFSNIQYTGSNASTQNLFGFQLGANYTLNHYWAVSAGGGPVWVDGQQGSSGQASSLSLSSVANISLSFNGQLAKFSTGYSNAVSPSSIGQTLQTHSIFANYSYQLSRHVFLGITSNLSRSQSIGDQSTDNITGQFNRSYFTASPSITWEIEKNWRLRANYIYRWQDYQQDNNVANLNTGASESNLVMLSLNYSWDGIHDFPIKN